MSAPVLLVMAAGMPPLGLAVAGFLLLAGAVRLWQGSLLLARALLGCPGRPRGRHQAGGEG